MIAFVTDDIKTYIILLIRMSATDHYGCAGFAIAAIICNFALSAESNDSRLLSLPKTEFMHVLTNIMKPPGDAADTAAAAAASRGLDSLSVQRLKSINATPRSLAAMQAHERDEMSGRRNISNINNISNYNNYKNVIKVNRKDSFHFLQLTLEKREKEVKEMKSGVRKRPSPRVYKADDDDVRYYDSEGSYLNRTQP
jgi:hypothetical protein